MARVEATQLNIRSRFARGRAQQIARQTGMTATQVVEEALRAYVPPSIGVPPSTGQERSCLIRKGRILVKPADGKLVTHAEVEAALEEIRSERG